MATIEQNASRTVGGAILCGGRGRRMGGDKASILFRGEPLLLRMVRIVQGMVAPIVIAARKDQTLPALPGDVEVVYDPVDDFGPLAGMEAAFAALSGRCAEVFVCACDYPLLRPEVVAALIARLGSGWGLVPCHDGVLHPLMAVYRVDSRDRLRALMDRGEHRAREFAREVGAASIDTNELREVDPTLDSFRNVNDLNVLRELE